MQRYRFLFCVVLLGSLIPQHASTDAQSPAQPYGVPVREVGRQFVLVGDLGRPLGEEIRILGRIVDDDDKGGRGLVLHIKQINQLPVNQPIEIVIRPYAGSFGLAKSSDSDEVLNAPLSPIEKSSAADMNYRAFPLLKEGQLYELVGYEIAAYEGTASAVLNRLKMPMQTVAGLYLRNHFTVLELREVSSP